MMKPQLRKPACLRQITHNPERAIPWKGRMTPPRSLLVCGLLLLLPLATACNDSAPRVEATVGSDGTLSDAGDRLVALPRPPILAAEGTGDLAKARLNAVRTRWGQLYRRTDARLVSVEALPFLTRTEAGRAFLAAEGERALARGWPAESCPAVVTTAPAETAGLGELVGQALSDCLAEVGAVSPDCGCQVLAVNDFLTVPREEMKYASGTAARMRVPALGLDEILVADEAEDGTLIRDLRGPVARVTRGPGSRVEVKLLRGDRAFEGRSIEVGFRRGRLAERIYATDAAGARMSLLIGFSPEELAEGAAAWLAWPEEG